MPPLPHRAVQAYCPSLLLILACGKSPTRATPPTPLPASVADASPSDAGPSTSDADLPVSCEQVTVAVGVGETGYRASGRLCSGLREGAWVYLDQRGNKRREGTFQVDREEGEWVFFYPSGTVRSRGRFEQGRRVGSWVRNHENGITSLQGSYKDGLRQGRWQRWHENGQLYEDRIYMEGRREGLHQKWNAAGELVFVRTCKEDVCTVLCTSTKRQPVCPPFDKDSLP